ncbi:unnamed protein product [Thlaspi arvense]|uniref:BTB domain-containing protein n=1 Tax=Thlaspi arvense TaxID=13288 RepID=A0AAU9RAT0_THLAR|nr:unnamed protein product [Thlaspi arvense]
MTSKSNVGTFLGGFAKILEKQWQCDVRLRAMDSDEGAYISAHKLVLVYIYDYRKNTVKTSAKLETVTLSEMKHEEVEALVEFIYSDGSTLSAKGRQNARSLFIAAHKYEIMHLRDLCRIKLAFSVDLTNALDVYKLSLIPYERYLNIAASEILRRLLLLKSLSCSSTRIQILLWR